MNRFRKLIFGFFLLFALVGNAQEMYTIERVVNELLESNFGIKIMRNEALIAKNNNNVGAAGYLPQITVNADRFWSAYDTRQTFFSGQVNEANGAKSNSISATAMLNWTFFDGFKMFAVDKRLDLEEDVATMNLTAEIEMKIYQTTVQFYTLLQFQELNAIYKQSIELSNARYEQQLLKEKLGSASEVQLIQSRLDLFADSSLFLKNLRDIEVTKATLNYLIGRDQSEPFEAKGSLDNLQTIDWKGIEASAVEQNTSILLNKANIAIRDQERKEVRSNYFPQVNFYAQYMYGRSENQVGILNSNRSLGPGIGFSLTWNILNDLSTFTQMKNVKISQENAELNLKDQKLFVSSELRKSYENYLWAVRNLELEKNNIGQVEENFKIARIAYENGAITDMELREFQFSTVQSQLRYFQAQLEQKTAELNLRLIAGDFKKMIE